MVKFDGYGPGWNTCEGCGGRLLLSGDTLRHRPGRKKAHDLVLRKKAEARQKAEALSEYDDFEVANMARGFCPDGCCGPDDDDGGCDELNPYCGDCYLCEARADDDYWWEVNRADVLQI